MGDEGRGGVRQELSGEMRPSLDLLNDALAGRYRVLRELGRGGMGRVFVADDLRRGGSVAVKVLHPEFAAILGATRFHREIEILSRLSHPSIVPVLDSDEAGALLYLVMPYVAGETLGQRLEREGHLSLDAVLRIAGHVAEAIDYAHSRGIIHRDIKPANILLSNERAIVCDFGVARAIDRAALEPISSSGLVLGTPAYMSPEQAMGRSELDAGCDIYALGCVIYEMLTGVQPFTGSTSQAIIARHIHEPPQSMRVVRADLPEKMERAVFAAMAKDPRARPQSGGELVRELHG
jgi:eukaryotic-like serine/threonine-protein kinase